LTLFLVSYMPLFLIMTVNQLYKKKDYLNWGGEQEGINNIH